MNYLSVCSGIEAATVAWHPLGWKAVAYSEIEPFPSAVLAHHYPDVQNVGDMTKFKEWDFGNQAVELLVGGTPCQSFSVAGLRKGLEDPRGNLALTYCGILDKFRPKWFVWENVPGVLSSGGGRDFGSFLGAVAELGYGFAYRVLDAQYFGVAQRRRRVFVVGYFGEWRPAAEVLFEPESLRRDTATSRKPGEEIAGTIAARFGISRNNHEECVATFDRQSSGEYGTAPIASTISARDYKSPTDLVYSLQGAGSTSKTANGSGWNEDVSFTLNSTDVHGVAQPIAFQLAGDRDNPSVSVSNVAFCLPANPMSDRGQAVAQSMAVRRLTPIECERLQGFPDNYTNIAYRNKTDSPDSPRYKSLGNSMAVPVMSWIGKKIEMVNKNLNNEG